VKTPRDVVVMAKRYLVEHPEACKAVLHGVTAPTSKFANKDKVNHEHGSVRCVVAFLGEPGFSPSIRFVFPSP
jgi:hypothetical protein